MFKKLKEKITEEVKSSPQRFAEFTQTVSDRLQSSSIPDDSLFSIGENDHNNSVSSVNNHGFSSVQLVSPSQDSRTRRNSGGSVASDISFLPRYEPSISYHLQSDLDVSASEIEDNASTASSQLGHLNKEQIYSAFQKAQMRYHKYRGRYTDLARHYKDLERENMKMKSVLVETQDKAIRRVTELKEQCNLEQKAKAHLESALRDEIDEKNYKINTLQTKIQLLQKDNNSDSLENVEDNSSQTEKLENLTKYLTEARREIEILNEKNQELKAGVIVFQSKEQEYKTKISNLEKEISIISEKEKENNLKLAQDKMELHNEILNKDSEIQTLKRENEVYKQNVASLESEAKTHSNTKLENLQSQNKKLIEKLENLSHRSNYLETELLKIESYKLEIENLKQKQYDESIEILELKKLNDQLTAEKNQLTLDLQALFEENKKMQEENDSLGKQIRSLREDAKQGLLSLEPKIRDKLQLQYTQREEELKREFASKIEELSFNNSSLKDIKLQLLLKDDLIGKITDELEQTKSDLSKTLEDYNNLEKNHLELIDDSSKLQNVITNLEKEKTSLETYVDKISRLEAHINTLQEELKEAKSISDKEKENTFLSQENFNLQQQIQAVNEKMKLLEEQNEAKTMECAEAKLQEMKLNKVEEEKNNTIKELEMERMKLHETLQKETEAREDHITSLQCCKNELEEEIKHLTELLNNEQLKITELQEQSLTYQNQIANLNKSIKMWEVKHETLNLDKTESDILKFKLQQLEENNKKISQSLDEEQQSFVKQLETFKFELCKNNKQLLKDDTVDFKDIITHIHEIHKQKEDEVVYLSKENTSLKEEVRNLQDKSRLLEESVHKIQMQQCDDKLLETKIQNLEVENKNLIAQIETERQSFNELLETHKEMQNKQVLTEQLGNEVANMHIEISGLQKTLSEREIEKIQLFEEKLNLEGTIRSLEKQIEAINLDKTECSLQKMQMLKLEEEKQHLLASFEEERISFNKFYEQHSKDENSAKHLSEENEQLMSEIQKLNEIVAQYSNTKNESDRKIEELISNLEVLRNENRKLKEELSDAAETKHFNSKEIERLITEMINLEKDLRDKVENIEELKKKTTAIGEEKALLEEKLQYTENLMSEKNTQVEAVQQDNSNFRERCNLLHNDLTNLHTEIDNLNQEIDTLRERSFKAADYESKFFLKENENHTLASQIEAANKEISELNNRIQQITSDNHNIMEECQNLMREKEELQFKLSVVLTNTQDVSQTKKLEESTNNNIQADSYNTQQKCDTLLIENKSLKTENSKLLEKCTNLDTAQRSLETQVRDFEKQYGEILIEKQLLQDEIQELRISHVSQNNSTPPSKLDRLNILKKEQTVNEDPDKETYINEIGILRDKVVKYKSLDLTNKSSIEFYENELEKLKNQNDKLNRKLDETLVTLHHCTELSNSSTEIEYLKNVLYNYMLGKESVTLARVIAAVCKFDQQQTETVLQREQHKQTLLGQLGLI